MGGGGLFELGGRPTIRHQLEHTFHHDVAEAVRKEQLDEYIRRHKLSIRFYQDYGLDTVECGMKNDIGFSIQMATKANEEC